MRKLIFALTFLFSVLFFKQADAQLSISFNISNQPRWGPVGYNYVQYYYLPDIDCYYYVPTRQFIYLSGTEWIYSSILPPRYRTYNLYNGYKVVINEPHPYLNHSYYHSRYASYRGRIGQSIIRDSRDPRYRPGYRPPVKPKPPGDKPWKPGNGGRPPGNGNKPEKPGNGGRPPGNGNKPEKPGNGGRPPGNGNKPGQPGNGSRPPGNSGTPTRPGNTTKPTNGAGRPQPKQGDNSGK